MSAIHVDPDTGVHYLDPIVYERCPHGWKVPDEERDRYDNPPHVSPPAAKPAEQARPLAHLVAELEAWVDLTPSLDQLLTSSYALDPLRTSRAANSVTKGAEAHRLTNPAGLLTVRLREITIPKGGHDRSRNQPAPRARQAHTASPGRTDPHPDSEKVTRPLESPGHPRTPKPEENPPSPRPLENRSDGLALGSTPPLADAYWDTLEQPKGEAA